MSREIKFEYGFESVNGIVKKVYDLGQIPRIKEICDVWNVLPIVYVRQSTGIKDKKGVEIYDGDICKVRYYNHSTPDSVLIQKVTYDLGTFSLVKEHTESKIEDDRTNVPLYYCFAPNEIEVIGNIYENPNLLQ